MLSGTEMVRQGVVGFKEDERSTIDGLGICVLWMLDVEPTFSMLERGIRNGSAIGVIRKRSSVHLNLE